VNREQMEAIRARANSATQGAWTYDGMHNEIHAYDAGEAFLIVSELREHPGEKLLDEFGHTYNSDFEFIAHARHDIPTLLDALDEMKIKRKSDLENMSILSEALSKCERIIEKCNLCRMSEEYQED